MGILNKITYPGIKTVDENLMSEGSRYCGDQLKSVDRVLIQRPKVIYLESVDVSHHENLLCHELVNDLG